MMLFLGFFCFFDLLFMMSEDDEYGSAMSSVVACTYQRGLVTHLWRMKSLWFRPLPIHVFQVDHLHGVGWV